MDTNTGTGAHFMARLSNDGSSVRFHFSRESSSLRFFCGRMLFLSSYRICALTLRFRGAVKYTNMQNLCLMQCCGSGTIWCGSGSHFYVDADPDPNFMYRYLGRKTKFLQNLELFFCKIKSKTNTYMIDKKLRYYLWVWGGMRNLG